MHLFRDYVRIQRKELDYSDIKNPLLSGFSIPLQQQEGPHENPIEQ